ncbi:MAG: class I SAM-dependent methyltransferase [Acidobacteriota bacterium]
MKVVVGKKVHLMDREEVTERAAPFEEVLVDLGTGDGRFVLGWARDHPETLAIGLDAVQDAMRDTSRRAAAKAARGGAANALFVVASAEDLPPELTGLASHVTINFPWGSLLRGVVAAEPWLLQGLTGLARPGARFTALVNYSVFQDDDYRERLGMPPLDLMASGEEFKEAWRRQGLLLEQSALLRKNVPHRTSWGQRLVKGSDRSTLLLTGTISK